MCGIRILYVEDDLVMNMAVTESLEAFGIEVNSVHSGPAAIAAINGLEYLTALVTDIDLGAGPDGFDVARHARRLYRGLPVIYVTGRMAAHHATHGVAGSRLIAKPFQSSQIREALRQLICREAA
jgi:CheY-like chemotaxis protein